MVVLNPPQSAPEKPWPNATPASQPRLAPRTVAMLALLVAGLLLAATTNLAKVAHDAGISPMMYLVWPLSGAALLLLGNAAWHRERLALNRRTIEYSMVSGFLTVAGANLIFFSAVSHLGVSFVALMIALPPLFTYVGALLLRMEAFNRWRALGVVLALTGTAILVLRQWGTPDADPVWIVITLAGPLLLSAGNLYRSRRWPPGVSAQALAPAMLLGAIILLTLYAWASDASLTLPRHPRDLALIALQAVIFAGQFLALFILQKAGGPVFLSVMGGVAAIFSVPIAMLVLGESALPALLPGSLLVAAGIASLLFGTRGTPAPPRPM